MKILNEEIVFVELLLRGELIGLVHSDPRDGFQHRDEEFLDADVVVFATAMIFGAVEPEDVDVFFQLRAFKVAGEFQDFRFGNRVIGPGAVVLALGGEKSNENEKGPEDAFFHRAKEELEYPGTELLLSFLSLGESRLC